jgi:dolichol-phosphate mannosyltransferase
MRYLWDKLGRLPLIGTVLRHRFTKFGSVGFSGTLVNLSVLYVGQEYLFAAVADPGTRLNLSLPLAMFLATLNNFTWNRAWTWRDRKKRLAKPIPVQLMQYFMASWLAITLQFVITKGLAGHFHYLLANGTAIVSAGLVNFLLNDAWTFGLRRWRSRISSGTQENSPASG